LIAARSEAQRFAVCNLVAIAALLYHCLFFREKRVIRYQEFAFRPLKQMQSNPTGSGANKPTAISIKFP
jgi:hypothetical protein